MDHTDLGLAGELPTDGRALLTRLLAAWARCRDPRLGELIERVSETIGVEPLSRQGPIARQHERWMALERAGDPADIQRLLAVFPIGRQEQGQAQLERLIARPPDPRVNTRLWSLLDDPPYRSAKAKPFWQAVLAALEQQADPRVVAELRERRARVGKIFARAMGRWLERELDERLPSLEQAAAAVPSELSPADAEAVSALDSRLARPASDRSPEQLLEAIYADPGDDELRRVYGDVLSARGDPRGELIVLQYAALDTGKRSRELARRERELLRQHGHAWLGELAPVLKRTGNTFERGFLSRAELSVRTPAPLRERVGHREWATVRHLELNKYPHQAAEALNALILHPVMRSLRSLDGIAYIQPALFWALVDSEIPRPLEALYFSNLTLAHPYRWSAMDGAARCPDEGPGFDPSEVERLTRCRGLPSLRALALRTSLVHARPEHLRWLLDSSLGRRLERLELQFLPTQLGAWLEEFGARRQSHALRELMLTTHRHSWTLTLSRGDRDDRWRLAARFVWPHVWRGGAQRPSAQVLAEALATLPEACLERFDVKYGHGYVPTDDDQAAVDRELRRGWPGRPLKEPR